MMKKTPLILLVLFVFTNLLQGANTSSSQDYERTLIKRQLKLINKPAIKSYTMHGDILDCVEINKQLAFEHPLLKNHSIQMEPKFKDYKEEPSTQHNSSFKILTSSQLLPKNIRCPSGTVLIKRIKEEDLIIREKHSKLLGGMISSIFDSSNKSVNDDRSSGHQLASLVTLENNKGAAGEINVWKPEVTPQQFSHAYVTVASGRDKGPVNGITAGWAVNPGLYDNYSTRLFTYWTTDGGKSTGCYNTMCPGFVQVSQKVPLGLILKPISIYGRNQYAITISIQQDETMKWWLKFEGEVVGYWPSEIFSSLGDGATGASWGGEIYSPPKEATPAMGSGHFPEEGFSKACVITELSLFGVKPFPTEQRLRMFLSKPDCYKIAYHNGRFGDYGHYVFFGGPPNCKL